MISNQCISLCIFRIRQITKAILGLKCINVFIKNRHERKITHIVKTENNCPFCCLLKESYVKTRTNRPSFMKTQCKHET